MAFKNEAFLQDTPIPHNDDAVIVTILSDQSIAYNVFMSPFGIALVCLEPWQRPYQNQYWVPGTIHKSGLVETRSCSGTRAIRVISWSYS